LFRRGPGQTYLKNALSKILFGLAEDNQLDLEVNPIKVYEQVINEEESETGKPSELPRKVTEDVAAANEAVQKKIPNRLAKLQQIAEQFLETIISSKDIVPYGIRWICKQIRLLTKAKFPQATKYEVSSLIGGFFLLRFINPAIVTPQTFLLVENKFSSTTKRNLTLIAKLLQNLASSNEVVLDENNNVSRREAYMAPLAPFMAENKDRLATFFGKLSEVEDLEDHLEMDKYTDLVRTKSLEISITFNEMYFLHDLLQSRIASLN